jgi:hypothetical protein
MRKSKLDNKITLKDKTFCIKDLSLLLFFEVIIVTISLFFTVN